VTGGLFTERKGVDMRSRGIITITAILALSTTGCGLFESTTTSIFDNTALQPRRLLVAFNGPTGADSQLALFTLDWRSGNTVHLAMSGDRDFAGPTISTNSTGRLILAFGHRTITTMSGYGNDRRLVTGPGSIHRAIALQPSTSSRMVYMASDGGEAFDIVLQHYGQDDATLVTSDASATVSYWTPAWAPDGLSFIYARLTPEGATLWRVQADGSGAVQLPIIADEIPTYAVFSPDGDEILVPGDLTSFQIADGTVGMFDHLRTTTDLESQLAAMGYELVGSPLTGPTHAGDATTPHRHAFGISACWPGGGQGDRIFFDALVADATGEPPHEVLGVAIFSWIPTVSALQRHTLPMPLSAAQTDGYRLSVFRPTLIP